MMMGICMASSYASIFMDKLKGEMLASAEMTSSTWWKCIDDVFSIWPHCEKTPFLNT